MTKQQLPEHLAAIEKRGYVVWSGDGPSPEIRSKFSEQPIKIGSIRPVRVWGLQVDDERELPGRERTSIADEQLWEVELIADDGSRYAVDSTYVNPAP